MSDAFLGNQLRLQINDNGTWRDLANSRSDAFEGKTDTIDVTNKDLADYVRKLPGNRSITLSLDAVFTNATTQRAAQQLAVSGVRNQYRLLDLAANEAVATLDGIITSCKRSGAHDGIETFSLTIESTGVPFTGPAITSGTTANATVGSAFSYTISATNTPTSYGASGLPAGLSVNATTGVISGTPIASGTTAITVSATNASGIGNATLTLVTVMPVPVVSSATTASGTQNAAFSYAITASNSPTSYGATGLPTGLSVNTTTGVISGTPTASGTSTITITATNTGGTGSTTLTLTVAATVAIANAQFDTWATTSQSFVYSGSYTPATVAIPDSWVTTPGSYSGNTPSVSRQAYATGSGSDATIKSAYVCRLAGATGTATKVAQTVAIPAGAAGHALTVKTWVKYGNSSTGPGSAGGSTLALGASSQADASFNTGSGVGGGVWVPITLSIPSNHSLAGTNQVLSVSGLLMSGNGNIWVEIAAVQIVIV